MGDSGVVKQSVVLSQNGDSTDRSSSILLKKTSSFLSMESIKSVSENPFFKNFGVRHNVPVDFRRNYRSHNQEQQENRHSLNSISSLNDEEEEDVLEYRPVSGFVNKLLDKFSSLNTRDEQTSSLSRLKRFSSLDQLQVESELSQDKISKTSSETSSTLDRPSKLSVSKAKSIENLSNTHLKPQKYNRYGSSLQSPGRNVDKYKASKFQSDSDLSRQDIIIIENTPSVSIKGLKSDESILKNASINSTSHSDNEFQDERPKPNTVLAVRTIFENASQTNLLLRRRTSDQPLSPSSPSFKAALSPLQTEQYASGQDEASKRNSLQSISPTSPRYGSETLSKPVLLPNSATFKRQFESQRQPSDVYFNSKPKDVQSLTLDSLISSGTNSSDLVAPSSDNSSSLSISETTSQPNNDYKSSSIEGVKITVSTKSSGSQISSSRSMASVKPILISEHSAPVKPLPLSTPASSTTTYQKSRPVVSVAPYREKPEDGHKSDHSSNLFTDSKLSPRHDKLQRSILDAQLTNFSIENKDDKINDNVILPKQAKQIFEKGISTKGVTEVNNKIQSHEKKSLNVSNKNTENNITNQNKIAKTTLEIRNSQTGMEDKEHQLLMETQNQVEKEFDLKPAKLVAESNTKLLRVKRMAPEPPGNSQTKSEMFSTTSKQISEDQNKNISLIIVSNEYTPQIPATKDIPPTKNDILPSKRPHSDYTETINEPPSKRPIEYESGFQKQPVQGSESQEQPVKGSQSEDQPVKGIPSIIAQRLKQPNSNTSQTNSGLIKFVDPSNQVNNTENNPYSRTLLTPAGLNKTPSENAEKSSHGSELENEITAVRRKMEANRSKSGGPAQIFDSSQLKKKKKKQQPTSGGAVPSLDLSAITDEIMEYQPQMTKVQPCNIVFVGENAKTARSLLDKKRKVKINIHFNDEKIETYEYPSQEVALEDYLEDHPNEREELVVLEDGVIGDSTDSSDDFEPEVYLAATPIKDGLLISNTSLSHSGNFQSYRGRYQEEYQFGTALVEEPKEVVDTEVDMNPDKLMLRPAEEDDTNTWSTSDSSDLLF